jgi:hypothetical protein
MLLLQRFCARVELICVTVALMIQQANSDSVTNRLHNNALVLPLKRVVITYRYSLLTDS